MNARKRQRYADCLTVFSVGAVLYTLTEILWRGHSHWTMTLTGGLCAMLIHVLNRRFREKKLFVRCVMGSAVVTSVEFLVGCIVNILLDWAVWDYSELPLNLMGQICLLYSIMWFFLSIPAIAFSSWLCNVRKNSCCVVFE